MIAHDIVFSIIRLAFCWWGSYVSDRLSMPEVGSPPWQGARRALNLISIRQVYGALHIRNRL
jgi:hypothetical protein